MRGTEMAGLCVASAVILPAGMKSGVDEMNKTTSFYVLSWTGCATVEYWVTILEPSHTGSNMGRILQLIIKKLSSINAADIFIYRLIKPSRSMTKLMSNLLSRIESQDRNLFGENPLAPW